MAADDTSDQRTRRIKATTRFRNHRGEPDSTAVTPEIKLISGMAPSCKLLSLKVMDGNDETAVGNVRGVIAALQYIQRLNGHGRRLPHTYGVSYFSSKGPTGDGRIKPDLVAPGEKVISCESSQMPEAVESRKKEKAETTSKSGESVPIVAHYRENSGTSQAAPHVSGVIAAFLSIRREFLHRPEEVKRIFMETATDLNRERYFQGRGLVDLMRAIQSV